MVFVEKSIDGQENQAFSSPFLAFPFTVATYFFLYPCDERKKLALQFQYFDEVAGQVFKNLPPSEDLAARNFIRDKYRSSVLY